MLKKFILYNSIFQYTTLLFNLIVGIFLFPFYVDTIGLQDYGIWVSALSIISLLLLFDPGFTFLVPQNIAKLRVESRENSINIFVTESIVVALLVCFILVFLFLLSIYLLTFLKLDSLTLVFLEHNKFIISFYILTQIFFILFNSISLGLQVIKFTGFLSIFSNFLYIFSIFYLLDLDYGNESFLYASVIKNLFFIIFQVLFLSIKIKLVAFNKLNFTEFKSNFANQNLSTLGAELPKTMPSLIVGYYDPSLLAVIKVFQSIPEFTRAIIEKPFYIMIAPLTEALKKNKLRALDKMPSIFLISFFSFCIFFILFNHSIIEVWMKQNIQINLNLELAIIFYIGIAFCSKIFVYFIYSEGKFNQINKVIYVIGFSTFLFSIFLFSKKLIFIYYLILFVSELCIIIYAFKYSSFLFSKFSQYLDKLCVYTFIFISGICAIFFFNVNSLNFYFKVFFFSLFVFLLIFSNKLITRKINILI